MGYGRAVALILAAGIVAGCASLAGVKERYVVCTYDQAWDAAVDAVKIRSVKVQDKNKGLIETTWLETPAPGRSFGVMQREVADSKDRSRLILTLQRVDDVTKVSFIEERERWAFRGGSRMFGWAPTEPSEEVMMEMQKRLDVKLKDRGCPTT